MQGTNETSTIIRLSALHAVCAAAYVVFVAFTVTHLSKVAAPVPAFVGAATLLMLFVVSAAIMALIVFGRPVVWFLNGEKIGAVRLAIGTVIGMAIIAAVFLFFVASIR